MAVITVSREYGSRGEEIARQVAKELGYGYFDKDILAEVAREAHTTEEELSRYDEKDEHGVRHLLKKLFLPDSPRWVDFPYYPGLEWSYSGMASEPKLDADEVVAFFRHVVESLWRRGNVVIIGRGGQKILAAKPDTLHVRFISSSISERGRQVKEEEGLSFTEALKKVETVDEQRAHYLKRFYNADIADARLYHLVVNTSLMNTEQAVQTIMTALRHLEKTSGTLKW